MEAGVSAVRVAAIFHVTKITVYRPQEHFDHDVNGTALDRRWNGRPRVTTVAEDRHIRTQHLRDLFQTASSLHVMWIVSKQ